jgi:type I restriction enzyme R subunit
MAQSETTVQASAAEIKRAADKIDFKMYEPAMRHLIDSYIDADESRRIGAFDNLTIVDIITRDGPDAAIKNLPKSVAENKDAVAEVIENNVRRLIIEEKPTNPKYFERMSELLDEIIRKRRQEALDYAKYLQGITDLIRNLKDPQTLTKYPASANSPAIRSLFDNLGGNENAALLVHKYILENKADEWRGSRIKERTISLAIKRALEECGVYNEKTVEMLLELARHQNEY